MGRTIEKSELDAALDAVEQEIWEIMRPFMTRAQFLAMSDQSRAAARDHAAAFEAELRARFTPNS